MKKFLLLATLLLITSTQTVKADILTDIEDAISIYKEIKSVFKTEQSETLVNSNQELANLDFQSGSDDELLLDLHLTESTPSHTTHSIQYSSLDNLGRSTGAIAYLTNESLSLKGRSEYEGTPTGLIKGQKNQDHGHLIADSLGGSEDLVNLASITRKLNRTTMQKYEAKVRKGLKNFENITYKVTPVYKNSDLMPKGFLLVSKSDNEYSEANFSVYLFNVQKNFTFDYATGVSTVDKTMQVK